MHYKTETEGQSFQREEASLIAITLIQIMILVLSVVSVYFAQMELAALLFALAALGIIGRIWAKATVKRFTVKVKAEKTRMFPDEEISVTYRMKNEKFLPVLWVDILQPLEYPVCMAPADETGSLCLRPMTKSEKEFFRYREEEKIRVFQERCSMIGPYRTVSFTTKWRAVQRGVYTLTHTRIYTGDGFGTTRYRMEPAAGSQNQFTIYPRIVAVNVERFVKNMWEGESGAKGTLEDLSVMKLTRPYESTDSLKKINWRLVARGQGLTVNQYEVISPRAVQFIFDGEAFNGPRPRMAELEDTLSILASLLLRLEERGMGCGFSFPETDQLDSVNIFAGEGSVGEILYRMAAYKLKRPELIKSTENGREEKIYSPSLFHEEGLLYAGQQISKYYFVTWNEEQAASSGLLKKMGNRPVEVLTFDRLIQLKEGGKQSGKTFDL